MARLSPGPSPPLEPCCRIKWFSTRHNLLVHGPATTRSTLRTFYSVNNQSSKKLLEDSLLKGLLIVWLYTGYVSVRNSHGMTTNNQPTKIIYKCLIDFCFQLWVITALFLTLTFLVIVALNSIWKFIMRLIVQSVNPIFNITEEISKLRKLVGI